MLVYDACPFLNENDLYELRINQHWNFVDKFIVVEAAQTHTGCPKPFNFDKKRFDKYAEKLLYIQIDFDDVDFAKTDLLDGFTNFAADEWILDNYQGNYFVRVLKELGAADDDIIYASSLDEIIREDAFRECMEIFKSTKDVKFPIKIPPNHPPHLQNYWRDCGNEGRLVRPIMGFYMDWYAYKFNLKSLIACPMGNITEYSTYKQILPATMRHLALFTHSSIGTAEDPAGWHFTYSDNADGGEILKKLDSYAHHADYLPGYEQYTKEKVILEIITKHTLKKDEVVYEKFPKYLVNNLDKFKDWIFEGDFEEYTTSLRENNNDI
tara:strand:- start:5665 stop:6636 length:972 start_codon:yes stop_codon:yes gene_type:complete